MKTQKTPRMFGLAAFAALHLAFSPPSILIGSAVSAATAGMEGQYVRWVSPPPDSIALGLNRPYSLELYSSANQGVTFTVVDGPAEVTGNLLTVTDLGRVTLAATATGDEVFRDETVTRTFNAPMAGFKLVDQVPLQTEYFWPVKVSDNVWVAPDGTQTNLIVLEITAGGEMRVAGRYEHSSWVNVAGVWEGHVYLHNGTQTLDVVDVRDPERPIFKGSFENPQSQSPARLPLFAEGKMVAINGNKFSTYSLENPVRPTLLGEGIVPGIGPGFEQIYHRGFVFVTDYFGRAGVIDLREPAWPRLVSRFTVDFGFHELSAEGDYLIVAGVYGNFAWYGGTVWDVSDVRQPRMAARLPSDPGIIRRTLLEGQRLYLTGSDLLEFDLSGIAQAQDGVLFPRRTIRAPEFSLVYGTNIFSHNGEDLLRGMIAEGTPQKISVEVEVIEGAAMLRARSTSGLPVSVRLSGDAYLDGSRIIVTNVTHSSDTARMAVIAEQAGNKIFLYERETFEIEAPILAPLQLFRPVDDSAQVGWVWLLPTTTSAGLPVAYTVESGPAVLSQDKLTFSAAGEVTLRARQAGNAVFQPIEKVFHILVGKRTQGIEFSPQSVSTPVTKISAIATSGLPVDLSVESGPGTFVNGELRASAPGTILLKARQAGNDLYAPKEATLTLPVRAPEFPSGSGLVRRLPFVRETEFKSNGSKLYVAESVDSLTFRFQIWDITDAANPIITASEALSLGIHNPRPIEIEVEGNVAAIAVGWYHSNVLALFDLDSNELAGQWALESPIWAIELQDQIIYAACADALKMVDISNPAAPRLIHEISADSIAGVAVWEESVCASGEWWDEAQGSLRPGVKIFRRVSNEQWEEQSFIPTTLQPVLAAADGLLFIQEYAAGTGYAMAVYSLAEAAGPRLISRAPIVNLISRLHPLGDWLVASSANERYLYDLTDIRRPVLLSRTFEYTANAGSAAIVGDLLYATVDQGIGIFRLPLRGQSVELSSAEKAGAGLERAYLNFTDSIQQIDVTGWQTAEAEAPLITLGARSNVPEAREVSYGASLSPRASGSGVGEIAPFFAIEKLRDGQRETLASMSYPSDYFDPARTYRIVFTTTAFLFDAELFEESETGLQTIGKLQVFDVPLQMASPTLWTGSRVDGQLRPGPIAVSLSNFSITGRDGPPRLVLDPGGELITGISGNVVLQTALDPASGWQDAAALSFRTNQAALSRTATIPLNAQRQFFRLRTLP